MDLKNLFGQQQERQQEGTSVKDSPLKSLEVDLKLYSESIKEVAVEIIVEGISTHPIFVAYQDQVAIGELILDKNELNANWSINASTLEELVQRGVILANKKDAFIKNYKKSHEFMCLFVVTPEGANFVFYPYQQ